MRRLALLAAIVTVGVGVVTAGVVVVGGPAAAARARSARRVDTTTGGEKAGAVILRRADQTGAVCSGKGTQIVAQFNLDPPRKASKARGIAEIVNKRWSDCVALLARGLKANNSHNAYAVWLYNTQTNARLLGFVSPPVGRKGRLRTEGTLPRHWRHFRKLIISLETNARPRQPHHIVLAGDLPQHRGIAGQRPLLHQPQPFTSHHPQLVHRS